MAEAQYTAFHFTQSNPPGPDQADVPTLLRTIATTVQDLGNITVADLILHNEITADGDWPSITVYYSKTDTE